MLGQNLNETDVEGLSNIVNFESLTLSVNNGISPRSFPLSENSSNGTTSRQLTQNVFIGPDNRNNNGNSIPIVTTGDSDDILSDFDSVSKILIPNINTIDIRTSSSNSTIGGTTTTTTTTTTMSDTYLTGVKLSSDNLKSSHGNYQNTIRQGQISAPNTPESLRRQHFLTRHTQPNRGGIENVNFRIMNSSHPPPAAKKEKMEFNQMMMRMNSEIRDLRPLSYHGKSMSQESTGGINFYNTTSSTSLTTSPIVSKRHVGSPSNSPRNKGKEIALINRRSMPVGTYLENRLRDKFDVSDLDTNLPRIDIEAIENHLRLAREEERKRRSDRDEIRRRLALESEELNEKSGGRKPSLHSRLQSSMNLQICFMNETASDSESPGSDNEAKNSQQPSSLPYVNLKVQSGSTIGGMEAMNRGNTEDFYARQARLQADARHALSQAKDLAKLQMSHEKEKRRYSPITEMVRNSLQKVGITLPPERRRVSRQLLTEMNVAQLQVIVNDLHSHIEELNEKLVSMLLDRDDLHMEQDSMLVDIEDLTRYLAAKDNSPHQSLPLIAPAKSLLGKK